MNDETRDWIVGSSLLVASLALMVVYGSGQLRFTFRFLRACLDTLGLLF